MSEKNIKKKQGVLDLMGANCASCAFAIEHSGRKLKGVTDVHVDADKKKIYIDYDGDDTVLKEIQEIVSKLGYSAEINKK